MAKQGKTLPARRPRSGSDGSLLIRSAESLGRVIGSLQRQLDGASKKLGVNGHAVGRPAQKQGKTASGQAAKTKTAKGASESAATKTRATADRKSKRASKAAVAKKSAGRNRSGAARKAAKGTR